MFLPRPSEKFGPPLEKSADAHGWVITRNSRIWLWTKKWLIDWEEKPRPPFNCQSNEFALFFTNFTKITILISVENCVKISRTNPALKKPNHPLCSNSIIIKLNDFNSTACHSFKIKWEPCMGVWRANGLLPTRSKICMFIDNLGKNNIFVAFRKKGNIFLPPPPPKILHSPRKKFVDVNDSHRQVERKAPKKGFFCFSFNEWVASHFTLNHRRPHWHWIWFYFIQMDVQLSFNYFDIMTDDIPALFDSSSTLYDGQVKKEYSI
jgi:hypothetical protein